MQSNQQPALLGASDFAIEIGATSVSTTATLGGVARMNAFIYLFPPGLALHSNPISEVNRPGW
jgi:hypothetical protein